MKLLAVLALLKEEPCLSSITLEKTTAFTRHASFVKASIEATVLDNAQPPNVLPSTVLLVLSRIIGENSQIISTLWTLYKDYIWQHASEISATASEEEIADFNRHGLSQQLSYCHLYPPTRVCQIYGCSGYRESDDIRTLSDPVTHKATLFTLRSGALPIFTTSLYCRKCNRRYHHNNYVHNETNARHYYSGVPGVIQVAQHYFMDAALLEFFSTSKVFGWLSALNCARIYNVSIAHRHSEVRNNTAAYPLAADLHRSRPASPPDWQSSLELQDVHVLNGFFLYSLLLDKAEHKRNLSLEHRSPSQRDRLKTALQMRNSQMEGVGQEEYTHACELCFLVSEDENGRKTKIHPAVCDGVTLGHPCCAVHDCHIPLLSNNHRYCPDHHRLNLLCAVTECGQPKEERFRTCGLPDHRALENNYFQRGNALFQLRHRLKKLSNGLIKDSAPISPDPGENDEEVALEGLQPDCTGKSELGNRKIKAYFGRRRTHNEELIMRPCGVILSRATFFGSESPSAVKDFAKATFPTPESTPEMFVFDSNCKVYEHLNNVGDQHFKDTGFPVDVFHFRTKHKETDTQCQLHCNPAAFPELIDSENGKWKINMSVCEQGNAWIGGYQAILRDMEATRYNFYLDEMIKRRNRYIVRELGRKGHYPWNIPSEVLFPNSCHDSSTIIE